MKIEVTRIYRKAVKKHLYSIVIKDLEINRQDYLNKVFFYLGNYLKGNLDQIIFIQTSFFEEKRTYHCKNTPRNQAAYIFKFIETTKNLYK